MQDTRLMEKSEPVSLEQGKLSQSYYTLPASAQAQHGGCEAGSEVPAAGGRLQCKRHDQMGQ